MGGRAAKPMMHGDGRDGESFFREAREAMAEGSPKSILVTGSGGGIGRPFAAKG